MFKSCSRCGKIHPRNHICTKGKVFKGGDERKLRKRADWKAKSIEIREKANNLCEVCRDNGRFIYENLEVHHIEKLSKHPELLLENENLICLCHRCHKKADAGELDADYLRTLAMIREQE